MGVKSGPHLVLCVDKGTEDYMIPFLLDHVDRSLKIKPAHNRKESKTDRIMKKMFDEPGRRVTGEKQRTTSVESA